MEQHVTINHGDKRRAAINALAIVGFIGLIFIGITLAIYAARYVPTALSRLSAAAVSLSEIFIPGDDDRSNGLTVLPFDDEDGDEDEDKTATSTPESTPDNDDDRPATGGGTTGTGTTGGGTTVTQIPVPVPVEPHGQADLTVAIDAIGYCDSNNTNSFRSAREIPDGERGGIKFTVRNVGTNVARSSEMHIKLPTSPSYTQKRGIDSMNPNDARVFTLCFDRTRSGDDREITVTVDADKDISESNERNNTATRTIDIER
jgi:hypothetical protein